MRFIKTNTVSAASFAFTVPAALLSLAGTSRAVLVPPSLQAGDILVNDLSAPNGALPLSNGNVTQYRNGIPIQIYTVNGASTFEGAAVTPDGNVVTTYRQPSANLAIFSPSGALVKSFSIAAQTSTPGDVSVFSDGVIAVSDQVHGQILEYDQKGNYLRALQPSFGISPFGNTATVGDNLWVADPTGQNVYEFDEQGNELNNFQVLTDTKAAFTPGDLVVSGGNLYVTDRASTVYRIPLNPQTPSDLGAADASIDASMGTGTGRITGIALAGDGSLYVTGEDKGSVLQFGATNSNFGTLLNTINLVNPDQPLFIEAVSVPEPATLSMVGLAAGMLLGRRRRA